MPAKKPDYSYTEVKDASGKLKEIIFMPSTIETIDQAFFNWVDDTVSPSSETNKGFKKVPVIRIQLLKVWHGLTFPILTMGYEVPGEAP